LEKKIQSERIGRPFPSVNGKQVRVNSKEATIKGGSPKKTNPTPKENLGTGGKEFREEKKRGKTGKGKNRHETLDDVGERKN